MERKKRGGWNGLRGGGGKCESRIKCEGEERSGEGVGVWIQGWRVQEEWGEGVQ